MASSNNSKEVILFGSIPNFSHDMSVISSNDFLTFSKASLFAAFKF